jgi:thymidylate synthase (FAD)
MPSLRCVGIPVVSLLFAIRKHQTLLMAQTHSASLISITPKAEDQIAYCARVSNPKNQENYDTAPRLLRYCIANNHWSPFEMANMVVVITTTRSIAAQILRHRSFSFQEFSQRYADASVLGNAGVPELRFQDTKNRQNSITDDHGNLSSTYGVRLQTHMAMAQALYQDMLDGGVAKECAREVLPLATPTTLFMNGTIRRICRRRPVPPSGGLGQENRPAPPLLCPIRAMAVSNPCPIRCPAQ